MKKYLKELQCIRQIMIMLRSEIKYTKVPLGEAFYHIGRRTKGEERTWLLTLAKKLEDKSGKTFTELWNNTLEQSEIKEKLKISDLEQLKVFGSNLGYLDEEMQFNAINLYLEQLGVEIERVRESMAVKTRLCHCFGVMGGIFLVILLM